MASSYILKILKKSFRRQIQMAFPVGTNEIFPDIEAK